MKKPQQSHIQKLFPWLIGTGIAVSHIAMSSNCSIPKAGNCSGCGSCIIALSVLTGWAILKKNKHSEETFFIEN